MLGEVVGIPAHQIAVHAVERAVARHRDAAPDRAEPRHHEPRHPPRRVVVDTDERGLRDDGVHHLDDGQARALSGRERPADRGMIRRRDHQPGPAHRPVGYARRDRVGIGLVEECHLNLDRRIERRHDPLEGRHKQGEERCLRAHQDDLDAEDAAMPLGQPARPVERPRREDHLLGCAWPHSAASVQDALDGGRANTRTGRDRCVDRFRQSYFLADSIPATQRRAGNATP